jgi:hypothetical protein
LHEDKSESQVNFPVAIRVKAEYGDENTASTAVRVKIENEDIDTANTSTSKKELHQHLSNQSSPFHDHPHAKSFKFPPSPSPNTSYHNAASTDPKKHTVSMNAINPHVDLPLTESPTFHISCFVPAALHAHTDPAPIDLETKIEKMNTSLRKLWGELERGFQSHLDGNEDRKESDGGKTRVVGAGSGSANDENVHIPSSSHIVSEPLQLSQLRRVLFTRDFFAIDSDSRSATALIVKSEPLTEAAAEETNINGLKSQISTLEKQSKDWVDLISHFEELLLSMDTEKSSPQSTISQLENERVKLQEKIHELEAKENLFWIKNGGTKLSLKTLSDDKAALERRLASLSAEKEGIEREVQELREKLSTIEKEKGEWLEHELALEKERDTRQEEEAAQEERIEELECIVYDRGLEIDHLDAKVKGLEQDLTALKSKNEKQDSEGGSEETTEIDFRKVTNEVKKLVDIVTTMRAQSKETNTWLADVKAELDAEESHFAEMQTLLSSLRAQSLDLNAHGESLKKKDGEIGLLSEEKRKPEMLVQSFEGMVNTLHTEIEKQKSRVELLEGQNLALLEGKSVLEQEKRMLSVQIEGLVAELENELGNTARLNDERKALEARAEEFDAVMLVKKQLEEENGELLAKIEDLKSELERKAALKDENGELLVKIGGLESKLENLKEPYEVEKKDLLKKISELEHDLLAATKFDGDLKGEHNCDHSKKLLEYEEKISDLESDKNRLENDNELLEQDKSSLFSTIVALSKKLLESEREVGRRDITLVGQDGAMPMSGRFTNIGRAGSRIVSDSSTDSDGGLTRRMKNAARVVPESFMKGGARVVSTGSNESYTTSLCKESFADDDMYGA